ncbi:MAG: DUF1735 and LamG domain-containing protein [Candidatus Cryptobacteroides sp.]
MRTSVIHSIFATIAVLLAVSGCDRQYHPSANPEIRVAYIEDFLGTETGSFSVEDAGGVYVISPRISGLAKSKENLVLEIAPDILERYNKANGTNFQILPAANFTFDIKADLGKVENEEKKVSVVVKEGSVGEKVQIKVHSMMKNGLSPEDPTHPEPLPTFNNYVIPVRMTYASVGKIQKNASEGILFLNRKFKSTVYFSSTGALTMVYKKIEPNVDNKPYDFDHEYKSWTYEVFFRPKSIRGNFGLVYPNYRHKNEDWGYTCFYGPNPTFFTAEGKQNFNQPGYEDYKFKNNTWYHIAGTFEPADNGMNIFRFYVNGELALELPTKGSTQGWQKAIIGNGGFNGWVRDFRIWERALSQGEIKETMWSIDPTSEGLVMYLPLEKDFKNAIPGHEEDWIHQSDKSSTNYHFNDSFVFPMEMK